MKRKKRDKNEAKSLDLDKIFVCIEKWGERDKNN